MASTEERMQILKMIEEGKISASEGAQLLRALDSKQSSGAYEPLKGPSNPRWFRVRVTDTTSGQQKVNVNIPLGLVNVGIKMGAKFAPNLDTGSYQQVIDAIKSGQQGKIIDIVDDEGGERVEIFVE